MPKLRLLAPLAVLGLVLAACGSSSDGALSAPAATVNGTDLSQDELQERVIAAIPPEALDPAESEDPAVPTPTAVDPDSPPPPLVREELSRWIVEQLVFDELDSRGIVLSEGDLLNGQYLTAPDAPEDVIRTSAGQVRLAYELDELDQPTVDDIDRWIVDNPPIANTCVSHILVDTEDDAVAVVERLDAGEDFAAVAVEVSVGPSGPDGGDLGCVAPGQFVPEFEDAMNAADVDEPTEPVESQFGWHVILVTEREVAEVDESAVELARRSILAEDLESLRDSYLEFLISAEDQVSVDPRYGTWLAEQGVVAPPEGADQPGVDTTAPDSTDASIPVETAG
ncbi:MAG: peptidyl-prolyl cis-trans isomerase [Acidimicrobiia bacterium]|nr:peptidyl-prolyl cis-trans isomerase [Acidimicrobiia bacterium]